MQVTVAILETREITHLVVPPLRNDIDLDLTGMYKQDDENKKNALHDQVLLLGP